jgi:hypothetical protein
MVMLEFSGPGAKERSYVMLKVELMKGIRSAEAFVKRSCVGTCELKLRAT